MITYATTTVMSSSFPPIISWCASIEAFAKGLLYLVSLDIFNARLAKHFEASPGLSSVHLVPMPIKVGAICCLSRHYSMSPGYKLSKRPSLPRIRMSRS